MLKLKKNTTKAKDAPGQLPLIVEETDENFKPTGIEHTAEESEARTDPYNPELIRVDPKMFSLRQVLDMIDDGDLELAPDFQRLKVWTPRQKSRLIESVLLRIPLPAFYFSSDLKGGLQVVDGLQRLSTIHDFVRGGRTGNDYFELDDLEYLQSELGKKRFTDINSQVWTRRLNSTQIIVNVIDPQTPNRVKFDIFRRINTGGSPLNSQEIRHCLSNITARNILKTMTELPSFKKATGNVFSYNHRMVDREVALRFIAFHRCPGLTEYPQYETMDEFLNAADEGMANLSASETSKIVKSFDRSMENNLALFGSHAFSKWALGENRVYPFNRALFDCWSVLLARYSINRLLPFKVKITERARQLMTEDTKFLESISAGTGDSRKVKLRFDRVTNVIKESLRD